MVTVTLYLPNQKPRVLGAVSATTREEAWAAISARWPFMPPNCLELDGLPDPPAPPQRSPREPAPLTRGQRAWRDRQRQLARSEHLRKHWLNKKRDPSP